MRPGCSQTVTGSATGCSCAESMKALTTATAQPGWDLRPQMHALDVLALSAPTDALCRLLLPWSMSYQGCSSPYHMIPASNAVTSALQEL